ncbi:MAG: Gfo/Idh/MocA family oxidoreductase, partial [bacterium]|nr:Gfo/Idh/MocA family oxidoreductase [bacterium]
LLVGQMMDARWSDDAWSQKPGIGGGNVISQGCHTADLLYYLAGDEPEVVYAEGGVLTHPGSNIIDNIVGTIRFKNGVVASIIQGDGGLNNFTSKFFIEVFAGEKGATLYNRCHDVMFWGIEPQHLQAETYSEDSKIDPEGDLNLLRAFVDYLLGFRNFVPKWQDGRRATAVINKLFEAIKTGIPQRL